MTNHHHPSPTTSAPAGRTLLVGWGAEGAARLTPKQAAFVRYFVSSGGVNATQAAILAGYSDRAKGAGAAVTACRLLRDPEVLAAIHRETENSVRAAIFALGLVREAASRARAHEAPRASADAAAAAPCVLQPMEHAE